MGIVPWNSKEGIDRLEATAYRLAFYHLAHLYERQAKPTYCGVASAVMVLNALRLCKGGLVLEQCLDVAVPETHGGGTMRYNAYTQNRYVRDLPKGVKSGHALEGRIGEDFDPGFALSSLAESLRHHLAEVRLRPARSKPEEGVKTLRQDIQAFVNDAKCYLVAHFDGKQLGLTTGGHFSPIAAYHPGSDSALVMDVAGHKSPWFWVPVSELYDAMHTRDGAHWRGWLLVSDRLGARR